MPRGSRTSWDLLQVIVRMLGLYSVEQISACTGVGISKIKSIESQFRSTGQIPQIPAVYHRPCRLSIGEVNYLIGSLAQSCDRSLEELRCGLQQVHGTTVSISTIWRTLKAHGMTMKKTTKVAAEQNATKRADYIARIGKYTPEQLVFVDESSVDRRTTYRRKGWSVRNRRAFRKTHFVQGKRYSLLPALSLDGILAIKILEGSFTSQTFGVFIDHLLDFMNPFPGRNSVVVMDNCHIHKDPEVLQAILDRGMFYEFLPPYSPDYNPIEEAFSTIKSFIRRNGDDMRLAMNLEDDMHVYAELYEAVWSITPAQAAGYFGHSGYI